MTLTLEDVGERVPRLLASLDQPLADRATVPLNALSEFARPRVTVALGGEGADELFGGYPRYRRLEQARRVHEALPSGTARPLAGVALRASAGWAPASRVARRLAPTPMLERNLDWVTAERRHARDSLYGPRLAAVARARVTRELGRRAGELEDGAAARWLMHLDQVHYLPDDVLVKTDRASMLVSLELRTVFLHAGLAELAGSLDTLDAPRPAQARRSCTRCCRPACCRALARAAIARRPFACPLPSGCGVRSRRRLPSSSSAARSTARATSIAAPSDAWHASTPAASATTATGSGRCSRSGCGPTASMVSRRAERAVARARPRLLLLTPDFPPAPGGIQVVAERLASEMDAFETLVVAPALPGAAAFDAASSLRIRRVARRRAVARWARRAAERSRAARRRRAFARI